MPRAPQLQNPDSAAFARVVVVGSGVVRVMVVVGSIVPSVEEVVVLVIGVFVVALVSSAAESSCR